MREIVRYALIGVLAGAQGIALGQVVSTEFNGAPETEQAWTRDFFCTPLRFSDNGTYVEVLEVGECKPPPVGDAEEFVLAASSFNGTSRWFVEFEVLATAGSQAIPGGAPAAMGTGNNFGLNYTATVASDQVKIFRDPAAGTLFIDVTPDIPHVVRLELSNGPASTFRWYVDRALVDEGDAEGPFPADDARVVWVGRAWMIPTVNRWSYFRYGVPAADASGDWDTDGQINSADVFYVQECFGRPDGDPGCTWADMDSDNDVDCDDWTLFTNAWTGSGSPPAFAPCAPALVPTVSQWGLIHMSLLALTAGTIALGRIRSQAARYGARK